MKKIIVRFKEGKAPSTAMSMSVIKENNPTPSFKRMYAIEPEIRKVNKDTMKMFAPNDTGAIEKFFEKQILPKKSEEEKKLFRTYTIEFENDSDATTAFERLKNDDAIEYVQVSKINKLYYLPDDPFFNRLWALPKINCPKAWDITLGDNVLVAVIDTGVDYNHPDLSGNMWKNDSGKCGYDFSDRDTDPLDYHGHGTHVAGTVAAVGNNAVGVTGVAPNAKIMAIKIFPNAYDDVCANAIKYAVDNGAKVLNNSWGPSERNPSNPALEDAVNYALSKGVTVVFAAGNENDDVRYYSPANHPGVICVAATDAKDNRCNFSNFGAEVTVSAPGDNILSTSINGGYTSKRGTSMAAPHVSALAALIIAKYPQATPAEVKKRIADYADKITADQLIGSGRINASNALV